MVVTREEIKKFANEIKDSQVEIVEEHLYLEDKDPDKTYLVIRSTTGKGTLFTAIEDWEAYAWLCGYSQEKEK